MRPLFLGFAKNHQMVERRSQIWERDQAFFQICFRCKKPKASTKTMAPSFIDHNIFFRICMSDKAEIIFCVIIGRQKIVIYYSASRQQNCYNSTPASLIDLSSYNLKSPHNTARRRNINLGDICALLPVDLRHTICSQTIHLRNHFLCFSSSESK